MDVNGQGVLSENACQSNRPLARNLAASKASNLRCGDSSGFFFLTSSFKDLLVASGWTCMWCSGDFSFQAVLWCAHPKPRPPQLLGRPRWNRRWPRGAEDAGRKTNPRAPGCSFLEGGTGEGGCVKGGSGPVYFYWEPYGGKWKEAKQVVNVVG